MELTKKRDINLEALRVFATFCVIMLHVSASNWGYIDVNTKSWEILNIYNSLVRFSTPIFVMISGVFLLDCKKNISIQGIFKKNIKKVAIAFVFWSFFYAIIPVISNKSSHTEFLKNFVAGHFHMWFLYMIIGIYIITPFLRKIAENEQLVKYFLVLSFIFVFLFKLLSVIPVISDIISVINTKMSINFVLGYTGYFFAGYYLKNKPVKNPKIIYFLGVIAIGFTIFATKYVTKLQNKAYIEFFSYYMPNVLIVSVAVFVLFLNLKIPEKFDKIVIILSNLSFGVYLIHPFVNTIIYKFITTSSINTIISVPLITSLSFFGSNFIIFSMKKLKIKHII